MLEDHVREGAQALLETQASLGDHTAALLALNNELRKKVSSADVDPALEELNTKLGEARKRMEAAGAATKESWAEAQSAAAHARPASLVHPQAPALNDLRFVQQRAPNPAVVAVLPILPGHGRTSPSFIPSFRGCAPPCEAGD